MRKNTAPRFLKVLLVIALTAAGAYVILLASVLIYFWANSRRIGFEQKTAEKVILQLKTGTLKPKSGIIKLPGYLADHISVNHKIYVTYRRDNLLILFPTYIDRDTNMEGYLFSEKPLGKEEESEILINTPEPFRGDIYSPVLVSRKLGANWCIVHRNFD